MLDRLAPVWIDSADGVAAVAEACRAAGVFALDTEADSLHSYYHKTCLIQVSAGGRHVVLDPLALAAVDLAPLWVVCADPAVQVVMHGSDYDIRVLDRDFGARIRGLVDTQIVAQIVGEPKTGLAALMATHLGITLDKKYQRADWGRRPLTASMLAYAAADTAFLERLLATLRQRAEELERWTWVEEECAAQERVRHSEPERDPLAFERIKGVRALKGEARDRAHALYEWREQAAAGLDIPPFKVLGNRPLFELAVTAPASREELKAVDGLGPRFAKRWGAKVLPVLASPGSAPERRRQPRRPQLAPEVKRRVADLLAARDRVASELGIEAGLLCPRALAVEIASRNGGATSREQLREAGLTGWRLDLLAAPVVKALRRRGEKPGR